jgi:hypothetical protein
MGPKHRLICLVVLVVACTWQGVNAWNGVQSRGSAWVGGWDNNFYLMWGRSIAVDGDVDFRNDIEYLANRVGLGPTPGLFAEFPDTAQPTEAGLLPNKYAMGTGVLALPMLKLAQLANSFAGNADPFSSLYFLAFVFSSILLACAGLWAAFRILIPVYGGNVATISVLSSVLGLSLGYYILVEPGMAHAAGFGCVTLFVWSALGWLSRIRSYAVSGQSNGLYASAFVMGLLLGISALVRFPSAVFAVVPLSMAVAAWLKDGRRNAGAWFKGGTGSLFVAAFGALLGFAPQLFAWQQMYGSMLVYSYGDKTFTLLPWHWATVLFGPVNGLFLWTPLALLAVIGLVLGARHGKLLCIGGLVALAANLWVYGSWAVPSLANSYGMRGFVEFSLFFMVGLAELMTWSKRVRPRIVRAGVAATLIALVGWNMYFVVCYRADIQPHGKPFAGMELFRHGERWVEQLLTDTGLRRLAPDRRDSVNAGSD